MRQTRLLLLFTLCLLSVFGVWAQHKVAPMTAGKVFVKIGDTEATAPVNLILLSGKTFAKKIN